MKQSYGDLWRLIRQGQPPRGKLVLATVLSLCSAATMLVYPLLTQQLVDQLGSGQTVGSLGWLAVCVLVGGLLLGAVSSIILAHIGQAISAVLRNTLIDKMLVLPISFYDATDTGERVSRVVNDCESISSLTTTHAINLVNGVLMLVGSLLVLFWLDAQLTLVLFGSLVIAFAMTGPAVMRMESLSKDIQELTAKFSGLLTHVFSEIRLIKAFASEPHERGRTRFMVEGLRKQGFRMALLRVVFQAVAGLAIPAALTIILVYGGVRIGSGALSMGTMTAFILYIFNIVGPLTQVGSFVTELQTAKGASTRLTAILQKHEEQTVPCSSEPARMRPLEFNHVSFRYTENNTNVLNKLSMTVEPGTTTALVGVSGSGKSTLLSLVERFYEPDEGQILYDGRPIEKYDLAAWRESIGFVPQASPIMPGSIRDNIAYGAQQVYSDQEIRAAAAKAQALEFIDSLPEGLDTRLIEQGMNLSGGQRQRISIARVFLRDPNLLLLDEATSSLDSDTEHEIQIALDSLMKNRTNIVIAHRLSTVMHADRICLVDKGRIAGAGTHSELYNQHPIYASFVDRQFRNTD